MVGAIYIFVNVRKIIWGCGEAIWDESEIWLIDGSSVLVDEAVVERKAMF